MIATILALAMVGAAPQADTLEAPAELIAVAMDRVVFSDAPEGTSYIFDAQASSVAMSLGRERGITARALQALSDASETTVRAARARDEIRCGAGVLRCAIEGDRWVLEVTELEKRDNGIVDITVRTRMVVPPGRLSGYTVTVSCRLVTTADGQREWTVVSVGPYRTG